MKKSAFLIVLSFSISFSQLSFSQQYSREVSFENPADSVKLDSLYEELSRVSREKKQLDTKDELFVQIRNLSKKGWREVVPSKGFVTYEEALEADEPKKIAKITIDRYADRSLPDLSRFPNLAELEIINSSVKNIARSRKSLRKIRNIYVYRSSVDTKLRLGKLRNLKKLEFALNSPGYLPTNFTKQKSLRSIKIKQQSLGDYKANLKRNRKLEELVFEGVKFNGEVKFSQNKSVKWLNMISCDLEEIPEFTYSFSNLVKLQLAKNKIEHAPAKLSQLKKLASLSFYENQLKSIDSAVFTLTKLEDIDLYHNQLKTLPENIGNLENLKIFYASFNQLQEIPESVGKLSKLKELYLHHNKLSYLPENFSGLKQLKNLHLNHNYFTTFPTTIVALKSLKEFKISHNNLGSIPSALVDLPNLKTIFAEENPLEKQFLEKEYDAIYQKADSAKVTLRL